MITQQPGIYRIRNTVNDKVYVGSAASLRRRWYEHRSQLKRGAHSNGYLQRAWNRYGEAAFVFEPLFICAKDMLLFYEQRALDTLAPDYNLTPTAGSSLGVKHSAETRARMSAANKGKTISPEHLNALLASRRGHPISEEHKEAIRAKATGRPCSEETKAKLRAANLGKKLSEEHKVAISAGVTGKRCGPRGPLSETHRAAISAGLTGVVRSEETRAKMSAARKARGLQQ